MSRYRRYILLAIPLCIIFAVDARICVCVFFTLFSFFQLDSILLYVVVDDGEYCTAAADAIAFCNFSSLAMVLFGFSRQNNTCRSCKTVDSIRHMQANHHRKRWTVDTITTHTICICEENRRRRRRKWKSKKKICPSAS